MNKKIMGIIIACVVVGIIILCITMNPNKEEGTPNYYTQIQMESNSIKDEERKDYTEISLSEYFTKYEDDNDTVILLGRDSCMYCNVAAPMLQKISKDYNFTIYYLNTDNFTQEDVNTLVNSNEFYQTNFGTPLVMVVGNSSIKSTVDELVDYNSYLDFFKKNNII